MFLTDPRRHHPFAQSSEDPDTITRDDVVASLIDVRGEETTALLAVFAEFAGDNELLVARIRRELANRPPVEPIWLANLSETQTYRAVRMVHVLDDGDNIMLGVRLPGGHELTCLVYVDHNVGTLVKDALVIPDSIERAEAKQRELTDDPDTRWDVLSLADARVWVDDAIKRGAITFPPFETEDWPACRALVEWVIRGLPAGGLEYPRTEYSPEDIAAIAARFFASSYGSPMDDADHRALLDALLWYGTDYGPGEPLKWSPVRIEILLDDWLPRKIVAPAEYLAKAPDLLRAFIRFAHAEVGIRSELTQEALSAVDHWEPVYQETIRSDRAQGAEAILAAMGVGPAGVRHHADDTEIVRWGLDRLARQVGGSAALDVLDDEPLPDEPFQWKGIPDDVVDRVQEVLDLTDRCCDQLLDVECRTACRRLLGRIAAAGSEVFRRKGRPETAAAAVVWVIGKVNDVFDLYGGGLQVNELMSHFRLTGSASQRAGTMLRTAGFDSGTVDLSLGSPDYLVASRRRDITEARDHYREMADGMG